MSVHEIMDWMNMEYQRTAVDSGKQKWSAKILFQCHAVCNKSRTDRCETELGFPRWTVSEPPLSHNHGPTWNVVFTKTLSCSLTSTLVESNRRELQKFDELTWFYTVSPNISDLVCHNRSLSPSIQLFVSTIRSSVQCFPNFLPWNNP